MYKNAEAIHHLIIEENRFWSQYCVEEPPGLDRDNVVFLRKFLPVGDKNLIKTEINAYYYNAWIAIHGLFTGIMEYYRSTQKPPHEVYKISASFSESVDIGFRMKGWYGAITVILYGKGIPPSERNRQ